MHNQLCTLGHPDNGGFNKNFRMFAKAMFLRAMATGEEQGLATVTIAEVDEHYKKCEIVWREGGRPPDHPTSVLDDSFFTARKHQHSKECAFCSLQQWEGYKWRHGEYCTYGKNTPFPNIIHLKQWTDKQQKQKQ